MTNPRPQNKTNPDPLDKASSTCYHCGEPVTSRNFKIGEKYFCCNGCKQVYLLLKDSELYTYYNLNSAPGTPVLDSENKTKFGYLDDASVVDKLTLHREGNIVGILLNIPSIHCSSCVYVLEKLYKLDPGIISSTVDFLRKELSLKYAEDETSLKKIVELLSSIGYEPQIDLTGGEGRARKGTHRDLYIKIGVAGFAFGNIMLLSLPEYLSLQNKVDPLLRTTFRSLSLLLALPVLLISARGYLKGALAGLKQGLVNIDLPISLGVLSLFGRSVYEIVSGAGSGYMDSFVGLVFLLLLGKLFQEKSYDSLSFERDYRSYFPVSVVRKTPAGEENIPLSKLKVGDRILVRNGEIVPADSILVRSDTLIDYSFVTGESDPVHKYTGEMLFAGGRQVGTAIEVDVIKRVSQSYLTQLWNQDIYNKHQKSPLMNLTDRVSRQFTAGVILIALGALFFWLPQDMLRGINAFTAVLIVACPCALALSSPFTHGTAMRIMGKNHFYLKNVNVIETMEKVNTVVFDKTGTLTYAGKTDIRFIPAPEQPDLTPEELQLIRSLVRHSSHPLSQRLYRQLDGKGPLPLQDYHEVAGKGIEGTVTDQIVKVGSATFIGIDEFDSSGSSTWVSVAGDFRGHFHFSNEYREGLQETLNELSPRYALSLLSGDNDKEKEVLENYFKAEDLHFNQSPFDKIKFISERQKSGEIVIMLGDGLNDAGSLEQSNVGISISEDKNAFSPACDGILAAAEFNKLPRFLNFSRDTKKIILTSFGISFLYNLLGVGYAVTGNLSPLISALLMPLSSVSVLAFATLTTRLAARHRELNL